MSSSGGGPLIVAGVSLVVVCPLKGSCSYWESCDASYLPHGEGGRALGSPLLLLLLVLSGLVKNLPKVASFSISFHSAKLCDLWNLLEY